MTSCLIQIMTLFTFAWFALVGVRAGVTVERPELLPLVNTYDQSPSAFTFQYPADWVAFVPEQGLLIVGPAAAQNSPIVPTLTVLRAQRLMSEAATLNEALEIYLRRGPLLPNQAWAIVAETSHTTLNNREALVVELAGATRLEDPPQHIQVFITRADNGIFYILAIGSSAEEWQTYLPTFRSILASVEIRE